MTPDSEDSDDFVAGAIKNIKLRNFLIYDRVDVKPGPNLNVIIGPNATGKSTIVNAICLGLAGKTTILGRARDLTAYIKNGCDKATIEIRLQGETRGDDPVIKRILNRSGNHASNWFINGKSVQQKQVEELVSSFNIQVSNLCQFLPQDRVADFVKMTNTELLTNTMQAVDVSLYEMHCKLKEAQKKSANMDSESEKLHETLEREKEITAALERDVINLEEKQEFERQLNHLKMKRPWVEYEEQRLLFVQLKSEKEELEKKLKEAQQANAPARQQLEKCKSRMNEHIADFRDIGTKILASSREVNSLNEKLHTFSEGMEDIERQLASKEQEETTRLKRIEAMRVQIGTIQAQLENLEDVDLLPEIEEKTRHVRELNREKHDLEESIRSLAAEKEAKRLEILAKEGELKRVKDVDSQKLNVVRRVDKDTYDAIMWLRQHRSEFEEQIYEPPLMTLNVKEKSNAKYLENTISFNDLKSFICISPADHEKFYRKVREEQRLVINAAVALKNGPEAYQPPAPIDQYKSYGFHAYLREMVDAPEPVMAYLCHLSGLHRIPVGNSKVNELIDEIPKRCPGISLYLSNTHSYSYKKSKYSGNVLTRSVDLRAASLLIHSQDESRLAELNSSLKVLRGEESDLSRQIDVYKKKLMDLEGEIEKAREERKQLIKRQNERKTLEEQLQLKRTSLAQFEEDRIDMVAERGKARQQLHKIQQKRLQAFNKLAEKTKTVVDVCKQRCKMGIRSVLASQVYHSKEAELTEANQRLTELERELSDKKNQLQQTKELAKNLHNEAKTAVGSPEGLSLDMQKIFQNLPKTLEEIDAMIADIQARVDLIFVDSDRRIIEEFKKGQEKIKKLEKKLAGKQANRTAQKDEITSLKEQWQPPLEQIISEINVQFSKFFREINCAGEVHLKKPADPDDYDHYGIGINVKYGDNKPMKELTTFQSGGERSVATVLYMLSLQELSKSPFRCVDEINQGMDAENERKVFELVVKTACRPGTPQYFLLTPKLLPDLLYTEKMTVHIVHNGPYMMEHTSWDVDSFIERRSQFIDD